MLRAMKSGKVGGLRGRVNVCASAAAWIQSTCFSKNPGWELKGAYLREPFTSVRKKISLRYSWVDKYIL